jgi:hypothetical protein
VFLDVAIFIVWLKLFCRYLDRIILLILGSGAFILNSSTFFHHFVRSFVTVCNKGISKLISTICLQNIIKWLRDRLPVLVRTDGRVASA